MKAELKNGKLIVPVEYDCTGDIDLNNTAITQLPDNLSVGGSLDLEGTAITQLPDNLKTNKVYRQTFRQGAPLK